MSFLNYFKGGPRFEAGRRIFTGLLCVFCLSQALIGEDRIELESGEVLIGRVLEQSTQDTLVIRSKVLGDLRIAREKVASVQLEKKEMKAEAPVAPQIPSEQAVAVEVNEAGQTEVTVTVETDTAGPNAEEEALNAAATALFATIETAGTVVDIVKGLESPKSWSGNLRAGINAGSGDRDWKESYLKGTLIVEPEGSLNYYRLNGSYTYRETTPPNRPAFKSTDKYDTDFTYRRTFADNWFFQNSLSWRVDQVKGLDKEQQFLVGLGFQYEWDKTIDFVIGAGGGVEEFESIFEDNRNGQNPVVNVFQEFTWKFFKKSQFTQSFNYYSNPEDSDFYNYEINAGLRFRLTQLLGLEFSYSKEFDSDLGDGSERVDTVFRNTLIVFF